MRIIKETNLKKLKKIYSGKVRDIYAYGNDNLLIITTDRISAFDFILEPIIPFKGIILNQISTYWFERTKNIIKNHVITANIEEFSEDIVSNEEDLYALTGRSVLVRKAKRLNVECVVRGYLAGNGYNEYKKNGYICGIKLPKGLKQAQKLLEPIFTPAYKNDKGHDENITFEKMINIYGKELSEKIREISINLYLFVAKEVKKRGLILADTKFEFGVIDGELILIDEIFTPDSSRYWNVEQYKVGTSPVSFDKQYVRDFLSSLKEWDKKSTPPKLPFHIVKETFKRYLEAYEKITGKNFSEIW